MHKLRRLIGDPEGRVLVSRAPGYLLRVGPGDVDFQEFESLVADGRTALDLSNVRREVAGFEGHFRWNPFYADSEGAVLAGRKGHATGFEGEFDQDDDEGLVAFLTAGYLHL